jgi:hypothetical protein
MPSPVMLAAAARRMPSPSRADKVAGAKGAEIGEASRELSVDDYFEDVGMIDAHMELPAGGSTAEVVHASAAPRNEAA